MDTRTAKEVKTVGEIVCDKYTNGVRVLVMRGPASWCVYLGVPIGHPLAGKDYDAIPLDCHGGLTFSSEGGGKTWPKDFWWYGYDYAHAGDFTDILGIRGEQFKDYNDHDWTVEEVVKDSISPAYDLGILMKLAESIKSN